MKTNKEIIAKIIEDLDLKFSNNRITKNKLIECWSKYRKEEYLFYGYNNATGMNKIYRKIFKVVNKPNRLRPWKAYILYLYGYKYCFKCENLYTLNKFSITNDNIDKLDRYCKTCRSNKNKKHYYNNIPQYFANSAKRRAAKLKRTSSWLTEDDLWMMQEAYSFAKEREKYTGIKWHVDHIIPLQGNLVSGLHVPNNLQVITAYDNLSKSNKY